MIIKLKDTREIRILFAYTQDTSVLSCLQGVMGEVYATEDLSSAMAILGDFSFYAGKPEEELITFLPDSFLFGELTMVPENEEWQQLIESSYGLRAERLTRYAIKKEGLQVFDRKKLSEAVCRLPEEYELRLIDRELYERCRSSDWCSSWVENYPSYECYKEHGLGMVILKDGEMVAGASSFSGYLQGIEVTIRTKEEYRRRGLAYICASALILACMDRGLYPSWDAANLKSVALCKKLGYHFDKEYAAYRVKL